MLGMYRKYPPGSILGVNGNDLLLADGKKEDLQKIFKEEMFCEFNPQGFTLLQDLTGEIRLLRKVVKEMIRRENLPITSQNEYNRSIASLAQKIGEPPEAVYLLLTPYVKELVDQMLKPKDQGTHGHRPRSRDRNRSHPGGGH